MTTTSDSNVSPTTGQNPLIRHLVECGVIPNRCRRFELSAAYNEAVTLTTEVLVTREQYELFLAALRDFESDYARRIVLSGVDGNQLDEVVAAISEDV